MNSHFSYQNLKKVVLFLSIRDDKETINENSKKPTMIEFYNKIKGVSKSQATMAS